ncbi:MAG: hypothetical protein AAFY36_07905 [Bacteroidota bacterium]
MKYLFKTTIAALLLAASVGIGDSSLNGTGEAGFIAGIGENGIFSPGETDLVASLDYNAFAFVREESSLLPGLGEGA